MMFPEMVVNQTVHVENVSCQVLSLFNLEFGISPFPAHDDNGTRLYLTGANIPYIVTTSLGTIVFVISNLSGIY
jgi:hypothetical protein